MNTSSELIEKAIAEAKSGNKAGAKNILAQVVKQEPGNAQAWNVLSRVVEEKEQVIYCLNQVLKITPDNSQVKTRLKNLQSEPTLKPSIPIQTKQKTKVSKKTAIVLVLASILGLCVILLGVSFGLNALGLLNQSTPTTELSQPLIITESKTNLAVVFTDTPDLEPTETIILTDTPIPSFTPLLPTVTLIPTEELLKGLAECIPVNTTTQKGLVVKVIDGDTIDVQLEDGNIYTVRYIGIDTPEKDRPFFFEASRENTNLVYQKDVILVKDISDVDQYNRLLRYVIVNDVFVNLELIRLGFAHAVTFPPDVACADLFASTLNQALASQVGLWAATLTPEPSAPKVIIVSVNKEAEYVDIQNTGNVDIDLSGWLLVSERGNQSCTLSGVLKVGETLRIWAGSSQDGGYSCGFSSNIWNNSESDPAVLYNPQGIEVSRK